MPIRGQDLIEIRADVDIILLKVFQPGSLALDRIGQQRKDFAEGNGDRWCRRLLSSYGGRTTIPVGPEVNSEFGASHRVSSLSS